jgi:hypothetical protein
METTEQHERQPLLSAHNHDVEEGITLAQAEPQPSKLDQFFKSKGFIYSILALLSIVCFKIIVYDLIMPPTIQEAINGQGSILQHVHLSSIYPIQANISSE